MDEIKWALLIIAAIASAGFIVGLFIGILIKTAKVFSK